MHLSRRSAITRIAAGFGIAAMTPHSSAQGDLLKIQLGFPTGGLPDLVARVVADVMSRELGVSAVVENHPGANGRLAAQAVVQSKPDGRTLLVAPASNIVFLPHIYKDLGYNPLKDLTPIAQFVENGFAFGVNKELPVQSLGQWADWCRSHPDEAMFGSPGAGSVMHFLGTLLRREMKVKSRHIPYKGTNLAFNDVIGGHIPSLWSTTAAMIPFHQRGSIRILGITDPERLSRIDDVPTFSELAHPSLNLVEGVWLLAPARTPAVQLEKLEKAALASIDSQGLMNIVTTLDATMAPMGRAALFDLMEREYKKRRADITASGFTLGS